MKKKTTFVLTALLMLFCVCANAQNNNNPIKGDVNEDGVVNTADVIAVINIIMNGGNSEQGEIIQSNSELWPRLRDKYGNPVLLTSIGDNSWGYSYTSDGRLAIFGKLEPEYYNNEEHFVVDGLTFKSEELSKSGSPIGWFNGNLELNQDGLITKAIVVYTGTNDKERLSYKYSVNYTFFYNSEKQLVKVEGEENDERYDENGNLVKNESGHGVQTRTWENGNLIKVEFTQDTGDLDLSSRKCNILTTYSYSNVLNVTKQPLEGQKHLLSDFGINHLYALGLFGVGPVNFPSGMSVTLNESGTINTLNNSQYTYAEP